MITFVVKILSFLCRVLLAPLLTPFVLSCFLSFFEVLFRMNSPTAGQHFHDIARFFKPVVLPSSFPGRHPVNELNQANSSSVAYTPQSHGMGGVKPIGMPLV